MPLCPECSGPLEVAQKKCPSCGVDLSGQSPETGAPDQDRTPTKIQETTARDKGQKTTFGDRRFVAGQVLAGRYRIISLVGKGGMGEVYKAEDLELDQTVALKFLPEEFSSNENLLKRFRGEVRTARQVSHPNVCRVFDIGEVEGVYYISMEFIEGDDLSMLLKRIGRLPSDKAVEISRQICLGLNAIHRAGILHRDLKPSNIIIDSNGEARITDFGIAGVEADVQGAEARVGTPAYMSPEQIRGEEVTKRSDIYSLGLLLYEIFTGKAAFEGGSVKEVADKQTKLTPTTPSDIVTGIDPLAEDVIEQCLRKDPEERPESALAVAMSLPGGDPLRVALEAGETPTPEMVAAAPSKGALKPIAAIALFTGFLALLLISLYFRAEYSVNGYTALEKPPAVLTDRARTLVNELGYTDPPVDSNAKFDADHAYLEYVRSRNNAEEWLEKLDPGQPAFYIFRYRQSPDYLLPFGFVGEITATNPPMVRPGMVTVELDVAGRLIRFNAVPPETLASGGSDSVDWERLFEAAGLKLSEFEEIEPARTPPVLADEIRAWKGDMAGPAEIPVTVEAAGFRGRPVHFKVVPPWRDPQSDAQQRLEQNRSVPAFLIFIFGLLIASLAGALLLVRYNIKNGRVDLRGALKIAAFCFCIYVASGLLGSDSPPTFLGKSGMLTRTAAFGLLNTSFIFLFYLAVEPLVRRRWPELLVTWNRLIMGNFRNPIIGRDILVGLTVLFTAILLETGFTFLESRSNPTALLGLVRVPEATNLTSIAYPVSGMFFELFNAIILGFWLMFLLLIMSLMIRIKWLSVLAAALTLAIPTGLAALSASAWTIPIAQFLTWFLIYYLLIRFGFVALLTYIFSSVGMAVTFDTSSFYFSNTVLAFGVPFALAAYALYISLTGRRIVKRSFLERAG
ncbi:MAG: protein kinase [Aridibacter famidurans]|nr:protein kinase [Aridibacter famidurans]